MGSHPVSDLHFYLIAGEASGDKLAADANANADGGDEAEHPPAPALALADAVTSAKIPQTVPFSARESWASIFTDILKVARDAAARGPGGHDAVVEALVCLLQLPTLLLADDGNSGRRGAKVRARTRELRQQVREAGTLAQALGLDPGRAASQVVEDAQLAAKMHHHAVNGNLGRALRLMDGLPVMPINDDVEVMLSGKHP